MGRSLGGSNKTQEGGFEGGHYKRSRYHDLSFWQCRCFGPIIGSIDDGDYFTYLLCVSSSSSFLLLVVTICAQSLAGFMQCSAAEATRCSREDTVKPLMCVLQLFRKFLESYK